MGSTSVREVKKWLLQRKSLPDRVAALVKRCIDGDMKPKEIKMSSDLYAQMAQAVAKKMGREACENLAIDPENPPAAGICISFGDHEFEITHDEKLPPASMHAIK
jgi:hypothetical protein